MERFLDYGCGDGNSSELMQNRIERKNWLRHFGGKDWIGIDVNEEYVAKSRSQITNGSELICSDGKHLPFKDKSFSVVHETGALHHMSSYNDGVKEIARVMDNGSHLYMREVVSNNPFYNSIRKIVGNWKGDEIDSYFTSEELLEKINDHFDVYHVEYYWRSVFSDALAMIDREGIVSLYYCKFISKILKLVRLDKFFCCHFLIEAHRRND